ncbi:ATP-NAD kinase-like domain-containing protein [Phascolomyces articulosus]|uniref:ATP-NAD kinase-like domain-containing protein n=1 Tax=Phascolomyces articulosus TaxID=60185 RepID=A0AAD5P6P3_9FUNG|nr:ATP-NAD kinase-like domain-containing protein [Phascolomyces articulosus]
MGVVLRITKNNKIISESGLKSKKGVVDLTPQNITDLGNNFSIKHTLKWEDYMDTILIITKAYDNQLVTYTRQVAEWIITTQSSGKGETFTVYVDGHLENSERFGYKELVQQNEVFENHLKFWTPRLIYKNPEIFHLIVLLGGDGSVLFTSWLFQTYVPPIVPFHLGSLSFLTPYPFEEYQKYLHPIFNGGKPRIALRMRLSCTIYRAVEDTKRQSTCQAKQCAITGAIWTRRAKSDGKDVRGKWQLMETEWMKEHLMKGNEEPVTKTDEEEQDEADHTHAISCCTTVPCETFQVLNELVVDRGPSPYMATLELFADEQHLCTVEADGLVVSTPTGSTAYSLSAGGSLCHPCVPAILITPICAHTLNFRPMLLPHTCIIRVVVRATARSTAYCSFDGKYRVELKRGDHMTVTFSRFAVPTVTRTGTNFDWFESLQKCLMWSLRQAEQKPFVVVESNKRKRRKPSPLSTGQSTPSSESSEHVLVCMDQGEDPKKQKPKKEEEYDEGFELVPWTTEELERDIMSLNEDET